MITEIATITVSTGNEAAFEANMREGGGLAALAACHGVIGLRFGHGIEHPSHFTFIVDWETMEMHTAARDSDNFKAFRAAFGDHAIGGTMEHFALN